MNVVDKFGRLIRMGVSSVVIPYPFSGAVDIIVVKQPDGTYRSTPWYVQFGRFQGALKDAEKIVTITVNGVEADFHMYLDDSGHAYFLHEVVPGSQHVDSNDQDSNDIGSLRTCDRDDLDNMFLEGSDLINDVEEDNLNLGNESEVKADDCRRLHDIRDEQFPIGCPSDSPGQSNHCDGSFENGQNLVKSSESSNSEMLLMSVDRHVCTTSMLKKEHTPITSNQVYPDFHHSHDEASGEDLDSSMAISSNGLFSHLDSSAYKEMGTLGHHNKSIEIEEAKEISICESEANNIERTDMEEILEGTSVGPSQDQDAFKSCLDLTAYAEGDDSPDLCSLALELEMRKKPEDTLFFTDIPLEGAEKIDNSSRCCTPMPHPASGFPCSVDVPAAGMETRDSRNEITDASDEKDIRATDHVNPSKSLLHLNGRSHPMNSVSEDSRNKFLDIENTVDEDSRVLSVPSVSAIRDEKDAPSGCIPRLQMPSIEEPNFSGSQKISGFGFEISLCGNLLHPGMGHIYAKEVFDAHRISEDEFQSHGPEIIKNESLIVRYEEAYYQWDKVAHVIVGITLFGVEYPVDRSNSIPVEEDLALVEDREESHVDPLSTFSRGWRLWSLAFRRSKSLRRSNSNGSSDDIFLDAESCFPNTPEGHLQTIIKTLSPRKNLLQTNIPTSEQISSLNLKDGQNAITFSCSTGVFGKKQVDAHIYVWKWNARIVISDVDGTITRSDVLGQVMPLVGKDWTQLGVASLFSAIKENGYQLLFLSARAIVQSDLTKRFLSNLKQDGKVLPSGPVVISPDGLLPSFYREVIRRAPHEFKIACLKDIRSLFPSDYNPFYAGFGNRDTDELTYRKIGIPEGKIFIINPKGEVALPNCTDVRSYTSLHSLVDDMFPPTSSREQEEYNSWNYWKLPYGSID